MKKIKFKKFIILSSILAISPVGVASFFVLNTINMNIKYLKENDNRNSDSLSKNLATSYSNDSLPFKDDLYSESNTSIGYLQISENTIYLVSWFGNELWNYDLLKSNFLNQGSNKVSVINSVHVIYLANYDRVLVYGVMNTSVSFVFQLNCADGSEYYVNPTSTAKIASSCLLSNGNSNVISSVNLINLISTNTAIMIPKQLNNNHELVCTIFSLKNFSNTPISYDVRGWWENVNNSLTQSNLGEIIGLTTNNSTTYISLKAWFSENNKYSISLITLKLVNNIFDKYYTWTFFTDSANNQINLDNAYFKYVTIFTTNGPKSYATMIKNDDESTSYTTNGSVYSRLLFIDGTNNNSPTMYDFKTNYPYYLTNIYKDSFNNKVYLLMRGINDYSKYYLFDTSKNSFSYDDFFTIPDISSNTKSSLHLRIIFDGKNTTSTNLSGIASIYNYSSSTTNITKRFTLSLASGSSTKFNISFNDWKATIVSDFSFLPSQFSNYLAQDMTLDFLKKYIYLKNIDSTSNDNLYDATLATNNVNKLVYDNSKGTVSGSLILNLKKWWVTNSSSSIESIIVPVNLSGFATTSQLSFNLVKSSDDDKNKWNNILNLEKNNFPSTITKEQILNNFIIAGAKLNISADDISLVNITNRDDTKNTSNVIVVYANDSDGTLKITYNLSSKNISPSITNTVGEYTYYNFNNRNSYSKITLNENALQSLKKSKAIFQVTISDLISCLNLSSGYSTDPSYWKWDTLISEISNKTQYVDNCIDGILIGKLSYDKSKDIGASGVSDQDSSITFDNSNASGYVTLTSLLGTNNNSSVYYNDAQASKIASSYNYNKVVSEFDNILKSSILFFNNWTTTDNLTYEILSNSNNKITFRLSFKDSIQTNIKDANNNSLVLDDTWISEINKKSSVLKFDNSCSFQYDLTHVTYSYGLTSDDNSISISDLTSNIGGTSKTIKEYSTLLPFQFIEKFYDSSNGTYDNFEKEFKIITIPTDTSAINYYTINSVQMVANDSNGTVTVFYNISFPNSGSVVGSSTTSTIIIKGFKSTENVSKMWTIICSSIASVIGFATICLLMYFLFSKYRYSKLRNDYGTGSKHKELNLESPNYRRKVFSNSSKNIRNRNTINKNTLANSSQKNIRKSIKEYNKFQKEIKKVK